MDISYSPAAEQFRAEVREFLASSLPSDWRGLGALEGDVARAFIAQWRQQLQAAGYLAPAWPTQYGGGGLTKLEQVVLVEEFARAGVPFNGENDTFSIKMVGNVLLRFGTEEQRAHFLPRILSGEDKWCQGFSEPEAGSDLASLRTKASLEGDSWVINGQKVWTSSAMTANWVFVLARTAPDKPRHEGITALLVPLDQPGIEIRPIKMMTGESEFNEVFLTDARTDAGNVVGEIDGGWDVARGLLGHERGEEAATNPIYFRAEFDRLLAMAQENGAANDPVIRQRLADCYSRVQIMRYLGLRTLTKWLTGERLGVDASISKLYWSEYHVLVTDLALDIAGLAAMTPTGRKPLRSYRADDPGAPNDTASWATVAMTARSGTIYAGTSEVQRNIIAETVFGLPRELRGDESVPA